MTGLRRRRLRLLAATAILPFALLLGVPAVGHAEELPTSGPELSLFGTICWEKGGPPGQRPIVRVILSEPVKHPVTVVFDTWDGSAVAPGDYLGQHGVPVTVPAGKVSVEVPLTVVADTLAEPDEWFKVTISKAVGATIAAGSDAVTIKDGSPPANQK